MPGTPGLVVELVGDLRPHVAEDRSSALSQAAQSLLSIGRHHVVRHVGVPRLERRAAQGIPGPEHQAGNDEAPRQHEEDAADRDSFQPDADGRSHGPLLAGWFSRVTQPVLMGVVALIVGGLAVYNFVQLASA